MKRKRIRTDHTEIDGRNNDSAHYHVLNLKLGPFKKPLDFSRPVIWHILPLIFRLKMAGPPVRSQPTFLSATQIPAGYHQIQRAVDAVALAGAGSVSDGAPPCWLVITCLYNGARP